MVFFFSTFDMYKLGKIRRHHWKERLTISIIAKFESDLLKTNEDTLLKVAKFYRRLYAGGHKLAQNKISKPVYVAKKA